MPVCRIKLYRICNAETRNRFGRRFSENILAVVTCRVRPHGLSSLSFDCLRSNIQEYTNIFFVFASAVDSEH